MPGLNTVTKKKGLSPGSLVFTGEQKVKEISIDIFRYNQSTVTEKKIDKIEQLKDYLSSDTVLWINICGLHDVDKLEQVRELFNINSLVLEDILNVAHSPKVEDHEEYVFLVSKSLVFDIKEKELLVEQISFILGKNYLITFQEEEGDEFDLIRDRIRGNKGRIRKQGADYLMYRLLDSVVDNYIVILHQFDEILENFEDDLLDKPDQETIEKIYHFRKEINRFRRSVVPLKETVFSLIKNFQPLITKSNLIFIRDLEDHIKNASDTAENYKEQVSNMIEIYRSSSQLKLNEIVKVLTIISTIFIPLTFIVGIYGMNFNTGISPFNMPELNWYFGYPVIMVLMIIIAVGLLIIFRKNKWI